MEQIDNLKIRYVNCDEQNFICLRVDDWANLKQKHYTDPNLIIYKNFDTESWRKGSELCSYKKIEEWGWQTKKLNYKNVDDMYLERKRIINEYIASMMAININENFIKNYLVIYESTEPSFFWEFLNHHNSLDTTNRKIFSIDNGQIKKDFFVLSNIKKFPNANKVWKSYSDFENYVFELVKEKENKEREKNDDRTSDRKI